jgi:hypothetical protein
LTTALVSTGVVSAVAAGDGVSAGTQAESSNKATINVLGIFDFTASSYLCFFSQLFYKSPPLIESDVNNICIFDLLISKYYLW